MKTLAIILVLIVLIVLALFFASALIVGQPIGEAAAVQMNREATPIENLAAMRESRQRAGMNWPFVGLLVAVVAVVGYLGIGDRTTKLLRSIKGLKSRPQRATSLQDTPTINIGQLPNSAPVPLPARTPQPNYLEVDSHE